MPTPTGKLKAGDRIRHISTGTTCVVVERLGNDMLYSVRLRLESGELFPRTTGGLSADRKTMLMTETAYWINHGWEVLS
jgi:hypothetical protein